MEKLQNPARKELAGGRVLHLMTIAPDIGHEFAGVRMSKEELMNDLVFGDGLATEDELIVNGRNALEELPRPDQFGNNRLALLAILDAMPPTIEMVLEVDQNDIQVAAD